ncbi:hypothetical protein PMAYCL1PPCAC_05307, partial [Pristionchus mayeri]
DSLFSLSGHFALIFRENHPHLSVVDIHFAHSDFSCLLLSCFSYSQFALENISRATCLLMTQPFPPVYSPLFLLRLFFVEFANVFQLKCKMTADSEEPFDRSDESYHHFCCCCETHVEKAVIVMGVIYFIVELYAVWNHFSDGNPTFPICFFSVAILLVFGIWKRNRKALLIFLILLSAILLVEFALCIHDLPELIKEFEDELKNSTAPATAPPPTMLIVETAVKIIHLCLRVFVGAYLFKVLLNFRQFIKESASQPPAPIQYTAIAEPIPYAAIAQQTPPPAYTSTD